MDEPRISPALPAELLLAIITESADFLNPANLMNFALVCREWRDLIVGEPSLWCRLDSEYSTTAQQWHLQLTRSAAAPLRVQIEESFTENNRPYQPELFTSIILQEAYIPRITALQVFIRSEALDNGLQFSCWHALADGRDWPALKVLRVRDCYEDAARFHVNIRVPLLEEISLSRTSALDWKSLILGQATQIIDWNFGAQSPADSVADLWRILPRLSNLREFSFAPASPLVTLGELARAAPAWDNLTNIDLSVLDATIQDIEAVLRLNPRLVHLYLDVQNEIAGSRATSHVSDQQGAFCTKLQTLSINHNTNTRHTSPSIRTTIVELLEDLLDHSDILNVTLYQLLIPRGSTLLSRCAALVTLHLTAVALDPTFIVDLQQCKNLSTIHLDVMWDCYTPPGGEWSALDNLVPLPRLGSAFLTSTDAFLPTANGNLDQMSDTPAASYGSAAFTRLTRDARGPVVIGARWLESADDIRLLLPRTVPPAVHISILIRAPQVDPRLLDVRLEGSSVDTDLSPILMSREFLIYQDLLPNLFNAVKFWLGQTSNVETVKFHQGLANRDPVVVQGALALFENSEFKSCYAPGSCSHYACPYEQTLPRT